MISHIPAGRPLFSLLEDTLVSAHSRRVTVRGRWGAIDVTDAGPLVREALHRMVLGPVSLENIPTLYDEFRRWRTSGEPGTQWRRLRRTLDQLGGFVVPSLGLQDGAGPIVSLMAVVADATFRCPHTEDTARIAVRPGTAITDVDGDRVLVCPGLPYTAVLHRSPATEIAKSLLDGETTILDVAEEALVAREVVSDVVAYLGSGGFILTDRTEKTDRTSTGPR